MLFVSPLLPVPLLTPDAAVTCYFAAAAWFVLGYARYGSFLGSTPGAVETR